MKNGNKVLFVEGTSDDKNGDLRIGFSSLLKQKLHGKMPRIIMGNGISETVDKFKNSNSFSVKVALIDLDGKGNKVTQNQNDKLKIIKKNFHTLKETDLVYFMLQKMEAWFLSQPDVLKNFFKQDFNKIPYDHPSKIEEPDVVLMKLTSNLGFNCYHKVRHGSRLLEKLNLSKLEGAFPDVKDLVKKLGS